MLTQLSPFILRIYMESPELTCVCNFGNMNGGGPLLRAIRSIFLTTGITYLLSNMLTGLEKFKILWDQFAVAQNAGDQCAIIQLQHNFDKALLREEEYWHSRSYICWKTCGDRNTTFFHKKATYQQLGTILQNYLTKKSHILFAR